MNRKQSFELFFRQISGLMDAADYHATLRAAEGMNPTFPPVPEMAGLNILSDLADDLEFWTRSPEAVLREANNLRAGTRYALVETGCEELVKLVKDEQLRASQRKARAQKRRKEEARRASTTHLGDILKAAMA